jgi:hypothetical protein
MAFEDNTLETSSRFPKIGLISLVLGFLAVLSVIGEYQILLYSWSGHENKILNIIFLILPWIAIALAISGIILFFISIYEKRSLWRLGIIGLLLSLLTFPLCCLLFAFFCVASGGLMGF